MPRPLLHWAVLAGAIVAAGPSSADDAPPTPVPHSPSKPSSPDPAPPAAPPKEACPVIPDPTKSAAPVAAAFSFEGLAKGAAVPPGFLPLSGRWGVVPEPAPPAEETGRGSPATDAAAKPPNAVLRQDQKVADYALILATGDGRAYGDATATVRFRPESGDEDASGGIVFRAVDEKNYGLVRANANEGNFRIYVVHNGFRRMIVSRDIEAPRLHEWHTLEVRFVGSTFVATLDGKDRVEAANDTLTAGWCGLWTKADSVTSFDDFRIDPIVRPEPAPAQPAQPATPSGK